MIIMMTMTRMIIVIMFGNAFEVGACTPVSNQELDHDDEEDSDRLVLLYD